MYVYLDIVKEFSCQMCGRCCRNDWQITLNEEKYLHNEQLFKSTGREREFKEAFISLSGKGGLDEYACIAKKPSGGCWFLADENYCRLHREAGHSHLDAVCQLFPRYPISSGRGQEFTLSFSCPAVIKLVSRIKPLEVVRSEEKPLDCLEGQFVAHVYPSQKQSSNPLRFYFELEQHFIDIMQWRGGLINERLKVLKETVHSIANLPKDSAMVKSELSGLFYKNYEYFDTKPCNAEASENMPQILLENFFVNFIFKKTFFLYGFTKTMDLLERSYHYIQTKCKNTDNQLSGVEQGIMDIEFQYGHNRKAIL